MKLLYPEFLFAIAAIAIPIIIHLFNFRKFKTVYFSNVQFLREIKLETQSKSKLKHLLVLASRILVIAFLVLAFAQPYIPRAGAGTETPDKAVSIYVDNSFSMEAASVSGALIEEARKKALEIETSFKASDRFQLITSDFEARHQRIFSKEELPSMMEEIQISPSVKLLSEVFSRQQEALNTLPGSSKISFIVSDFQKNTFNINDLKNDTATSVYLIPVVANLSSNVYIDTCFFTSPVRKLNQPEELIVRLRNNSSEAVENVPVKLIINNVQKALASFSAGAGETQELTLSFTISESGFQSAELSIADYPVTYDDAFYFSFSVAEHIRILSINGDKENKSVQTLFGRDSLFRVANRPENNLNYASFSENNLIIVNELKSISSGLAQELRRFMESGGSVLVVPSAQADINSYNEFLLSVNANTIVSADTGSTMKVEKINFESEIYRTVFEKVSENIDLPQVKKYFSLNQAVRTTEEYLLKMNGGKSFLSKYNFGQGKFYFSASPFNPAAGNFVKHALFVPTMYNIAMFSSRIDKLFYTISQDNLVELNNVVTSAGEGTYRIMKAGGDFEVIPEQKILGSTVSIMLHNQVREAGNYFVKAGNDTVLAISFNYDRKESDLTCFTSDELEKMISQLGYENFSVISSRNKDVATSFTELSEGKKLWKYFLMLTLLFLGIEVLLIRFLK